MLLYLFTQGHTLTTRQREPETFAHPLWQKLELAGPDPSSLLVLLSFISEEIIEHFYIPNSETEKYQTLAMT